MPNDMNTVLQSSKIQKEPTHNESILVERILKSVSHWLPTQGPIKDFVHHNTLHAFQNHPFHEGIIRASQMYGGSPYLSLSDYQKRYQNKEISDSGIDRALSAHSSDPKERERLRKQMMESVPSPVVPGLVAKGIRKEWLKNNHVLLNSLVHPVLFRILSNYLDQGVAIWTMPYSDERLWAAVGRLVSESYLPFGPLSDPHCRELLKLEPAKVIHTLLTRMVGSESYFETYVLELLLGHPGWSGMIQMAETQPENLVIPRPVKLLDAVAVELLLEYAFLVRELGENFQPITTYSTKVSPNSYLHPAEWTHVRILQKVWQEAFEWTFYETVIEAIEGSRKLGSPAVCAPSADLFFCIDDREEPLRRHIEETNPKLKTWGVPGFFGIDWMFQSAASGYASKLCPAPLSPKYLVREKPSGATNGLKPSLLQWLHLAPSNTLIRGWFISQVVGFWHGIKLAWEVFLPSRHRPSDQSISHIEPQGELQILRTGEEKNAAGLFLGFSLNEMADRVFGLLSTIGFTKDFSKLLVFVSHGASSVNNPYFSAYDCGACSGRPGAPNARAFAWMANDSRVRKLVSERGIVIPDDTHVIGAFHDTTRDEVIYFGSDEIPEAQQEIFQEMKRSVELALTQNAEERCRNFELVGKVTSGIESLNHVRERAASIFEPRPELNHSNNSLCIIGTHRFTKGIFLDGRAFLNSYDPLQDPDGTKLTAILGAAVPVCGGINLEYYFSRVDSNVYGAGTKLPHNVVGLVGVANGVEGDLLTGLPTQMTEIHDPLRLMMIVEQEEDIVLDAIRRNSVVLEWVVHHWIRFCCISPSTGKCFIFEDGEFRPFQLNEYRTLATSKNSASVTKGKQGNLRPCLIVKEQKL